MSDGEAPMNRAQRRKQARAERREKNLSKKRRDFAREKANRRDDADRRARMRELDETSPMRPSKADLIVGPAASRELARMRRDGKA